MTVPYRLHPNRTESSCSLKSTRERVSLIDKNRIESSYERPPLDTGEDRAEISNCRRLFNAAFKSAAEDTFVNEFFVRFESYQVSLIMTHRDRAGDPPGRREAAGPAGHRQGFPTPPRAPAAGSPGRPERRLPKAYGRPIAFGRGAWLPMSRIATPRACSPKALGNRLYGSLSTRFGIRPLGQSRRRLGKAKRVPVCA